MRKSVVGALVVVVVAVVAIPVIASGKPAQGCDQAQENDGDVYDSTCDGSPSENGNGGGNATGKPCAGCVGAADNKNPNGQMPGPQDNNNGYECDGNNGIAKGNPAHSACEPYSGGRVTQDKKIQGKQVSSFTDRPEETFPLGSKILLGALLGSLLLAAFFKVVYRRARE